MPSLSMGPVQIRKTPGWEFFHRYDISTDEFQLFVRLLDHTGQRWVVEPLVLRKQDRALPQPPTFGGPRPEIEDNIASADINGFLQSALDVAWEIGLRPTATDYTNANSEIAAVRYHLEDMRKLAKVK